MKKVTNNILKGMASRFSATVMLLAIGCIGAFAQGNKLHIEDFAIAPGETKTLEICMDNEDLVSSLQFDLAFDVNNSSLEFVEGSMEKVLDRITKKSHSIRVEKYGDGEGYYRVLVTSESSTLKESPIKNKSGAILSFDVKAADSFKGGEIRISNIIACDGTSEEPVAVEFKSISKTTVTPFVGFADTEYDEIYLRPQVVFPVTVSLDNIIDIAGFQARITLPEGVNFTEDEDEEYVTFNSERISENVKYSVFPVPGETNVYTLVISAVTGEVFEGYEGDLFTLNLTANKDFEKGDVVVSDIVVSSKFGYSYDVNKDEPLVVTIQAASDPTLDGVWDLKDITAVKIALLNSDDSLDYDVNGDGVVNLADYTATVLKVMAQ